MISTLPSAQEIYKWTDEDGQVKYGDTPPGEASNLAPVTISPGPSDAQKQQAEAIKQTQRQTADEYKARRAERAAKAAKKVSEQQPTVEVTQEKNPNNIILQPCGKRGFQPNRPCKETKPRPVHPIAPARPAKPVTLPAR